MIKTSGSDSYTDNYAVSDSMGTSGVVTITFTPSAVDGKNYVGGIKQGTSAPANLNDAIPISFLGAGSTGNCYMRVLDATVGDTISGVTTSTVFRIDYDIDSNDYDFIVDGVSKLTGSLDSAITDASGAYGANQASVGCENITQTGSAPPTPSSTVQGLIMYKSNYK